MASIEEIQAFWNSVDVDMDRIEKIYAMIANGVQKENALLKNDDERKAWDFIAKDMEDNQPPVGSHWDVPFEF